jgi:hypothetical protein
LPLIESASCFRLPKIVGRESSIAAALDAQGRCRYKIQVDGIAELWVKSQAGFDAYSSSPATKPLRDDGATFIGREIDLRASSTPATFHGDDFLGILLTSTTIPKNGAIIWETPTIRVKTMRSATG